MTGSDARCFWASPPLKLHVECFEVAVQDSLRRTRYWRLHGSETALAHLFIFKTIKELCDFGHSEVFQGLNFKRLCFDLTQSERETLTQLTIIEKKWHSERWYVDIFRYGITLDVAVQYVLSTIFPWTVLLNGYIL